MAPDLTGGDARAHVVEQCPQADALGALAATELATPDRPLPTKKRPDATDSLCDRECIPSYCLSSFTDLQRIEDAVTNIDVEVLIGPSANDINDRTLGVSRDNKDLAKGDLRRRSLTLSLES